MDAAEQGGAGGPPGGPVEFRVTPEEKEAVERVCFL